MLQVVEINAIEHLETIRLRWMSLFYDTPGASYIHTLDWLKTYWRHFRDGQRLRVLLVHRSGTVLGILPLVVRHELTAVGRVDVLTYPTIHRSQFCGPIGPNPTATLMAALRHLAGRIRDWDVLSLGEIGEHDRGRTANALKLAGFYPHEVVSGSVSKVCFDRSWDEDHADCGAQVVEGDSDRAGESKSPSDLRLERIRPLDGQHDDNQLLGGLVEECLSLQRPISFAELPAEKSAALLHDLVSVAHRLGMLDLNLLRLDGRLVAFSFNVHFDGVLHQLAAGAIDLSRIPYDGPPRPSVEESTASEGRRTKEPSLTASGVAASPTFQPDSILALRMRRDSVARNDRHIYLHESVGDISIWGVPERLRIVSYQHRVAFPYRTRLMQLGNWLSQRTRQVDSLNLQCADD